MTKNTEPGTVSYQILQNMQAKQTEELLQIWKRNDRKEWTAEAFDVIHQVLQQRLVDVPDQPPPSGDDVLNENAAQDADAAEDEGDEDKPFHDPYKIMGIASMAKSGSWIILILGIGLSILRVAEFATTQGLSAAFSDASTYGLVYGIGSTAITWGVNFVILQTISEGLYLLMDIEENTRQAKQGAD